MSNSVGLPNSKVGEPFSAAEEIGLAVGLFEPPRISYEVSQIEVGSRRYTGSFSLEMQGRVVKCNAPAFELRRCRIDLETTPKHLRDSLGAVSFYEDEFNKSDGYLGNFRLELEVQFIRDLLAFLQIKNLMTRSAVDREHEDADSENPEDNGQFSLSPIKGLDLTINNERRFSKPTEKDPGRRWITYEVKQLRFLLYTLSFSQFGTRAKEVLRTKRRFCQNAEAVDYNGVEVSPLSIRAERWSLLGAIKSCYRKYYDAEAIIHKIASHIGSSRPSHEAAGDEEAIIRTFNDKEGYETVKTMLDKLDV
jgi:hypothetical protein